MAMEFAETAPRGLGVAAVGAVAGAVLGLAIALALRDAGYPAGRATALATSELGLWSGLVGACWYVSRRRGTGSFVRDMHWSFRPVDLGKLVEQIKQRVARTST